MQSHYKTIKWIFWKPGIILAALIAGLPETIIAFLYWLAPDPFQQMVREKIRHFLVDHWQVLLVWALIILVVYMYLKIHALINTEIPTKVAIDFEDDDYYRRGEHWEIDNIGIVHTLSIGLRSIGGETLSDCYVSLEDLFNERGFRPFQELPTQLERKDGIGVVKLRPDAPKLAYVASAKQSTPDGLIYLRLARPRDGRLEKYIHGIPNGNYTVKIGLFAMEGKPCIRFFNLFIDEGGTLRMVPKDK